MKRTARSLALILLLSLLLVACSASALERAREAYAGGDTETAITEFTAALAEELEPPDRAAAFEERGNVQREIGESNAALADYAEAIAVTDETGATVADLPFLHRKRVDILKSSGDLNGAIDEIDALRALDGNSAELPLEQATLYVELEQWDDVVTASSDALAINPSSGDALSMRGNAHLQLRNFEDAIIDLKASLQGDIDAASADVNSRSNLADAYNRLGQGLRDIGEYEDAITNFTSSLEYAEGNESIADVLSDRGFVYSEMDEDDLALADFDRAISLDPTLAIAYAYRSYAYSDKESFDAAIADASRAVELGGDLSDNTQSAIYHARAFSYMQTGEYELAIADATTSIELAGVDDPSTARTYNIRSRMYRSLDDYDNALADVTQAIEVGSGDVVSLDSFYYQRSLVHYGLGNYASALEDIDASLGLGEPTAFRYEVQGDIYDALDDVDSAVVSYQNAISLDPDSPWLHNYLGDLYYDDEDMGSAETEYRAAIRLDDQVSLFHENLAFALREQERYEESIDAYSDALVADPDASGSWFGRGYVRYLLSEDADSITDLEKAKTYDISEGLAELIEELLAEMR